MNKAKACVFALSALAICGLLLPSCDNGGGASGSASDTSSSSTDLPALDPSQITSITIKDTAETTVVIGSTVEVRPNIQVRLSGSSESISGDERSYAMTLTATTPNVTVNNDAGTFTVTGAGSYGVRITIGTTNRLWQGTGITQTAKEMRDLAASLSDTYRARLYISNSLMLRVYHDTNYVQIEQAGADTYGLIRTGLDHTYEYTLGSNGEIEVQPGRYMDLSQLVVGVPLDIPEDAITDVVDDDGNVTGQIMSNSAFSDVAYYSSLQDISADALDQSNAVVELSTVEATDSDTLGLQMDVMFPDSTTPQFTLILDCINQKDLVPACQDYIDSNAEPAALHNESIEGLLDSIITNKTSYTLIGSSSVGYFDGNGYWVDYEDPTTIATAQGFGFTGIAGAVSFVTSDSAFTYNIDGDVSAYLPSGQDGDENVYAVTGSITLPTEENPNIDISTFKQSEIADSGIDVAGTATADGTSEGIWSPGLGYSLSASGQNYFAPAPITIADLSAEALHNVDLRISEDIPVTDQTGTVNATQHVAVMTPYGDEDLGNFINMIMANVPMTGWNDAFIITGLTDSTYTLPWYAFANVAQIVYNDYDAASEALGYSDTLQFLFTVSGFGAALIDGQYVSMELCWNVTITDIGSTELPAGFKDAVNFSSVTTPAA